MELNPLHSTGGNFHRPSTLAILFPGYHLFNTCIDVATADSLLAWAPWKEPSECIWSLPLPEPFPKLYQQSAEAQTAPVYPAINFAGISVPPWFLIQVGNGSRLSFRKQTGIEPWASTVFPLAKADSFSFLMEIHPNALTTLFISALFLINLEENQTSQVDRVYCSSTKPAFSAVKIHISY